MLLLSFIHIFHLICYPSAVYLHIHVYMDSQVDADEETVTNTTENGVIMLIKND